MSVATWSLRERAVWSLPPTGPAISVSRRSIAMWMSSSSASEREGAGLELLLHPLEAREQRVAVGVGDDPGGGEHRRVGARLLDVVGAEPPVEPDRGVELAEDRVLGLGEARHTGIMPGMEPVVRPARPDDDGAAGCSTSRPRPYYDAMRAASGARPAHPGRGLSARAGTRRAGRSAASRWSTARSSGCWPPSRSHDGDALARRFIRLTLPRLPPWRLPGAGAPPARRRRRLAAAAAAAALRRRAGRRARLAPPAASRAPCWPRPTRLAAAAGPPRRRARHGDREPRRARALRAQRLRASAGCGPCPTSAAPRAIGGSGFVGYVKRRA